MNLTFIVRGKYEICLDHLCRTISISQLLLKFCILGWVFKCGIGFSRPSAIECKIHAKYEIDGKTRLNYFCYLGNG